MSSPATEAESDLKNANVSSHQIPQTVEETNSEELIGMKNEFSRTLPKYIISIEYQVTRVWKKDLDQF